MVPFKYVPNLPGRVTFSQGSYIFLEKKPARFVYLKKYNWKNHFHIDFII